MTLLIDGEEAFGRTAEDIEKAKSSIGIVQLFFGVPKFNADPIKEKPGLVFAFDPATPIKPEDPLPAGQEPTGKPRPGDKRPERLLLAAAARKVSVRVLLNEPVLGWPEGAFWMIALPTAAAGLGVGATGLLLMAMGVGFALLPVIAVTSILLFNIMGLLAAKALNGASDVPELRKYVDKGLNGIAQPRGDINVRGFTQEVPDHGVLHTKLLVVDDARAVLLGSPFSQRYFDDQLHAIDNPKRGNTTADVTHDVSIAVVGPAVRHLHEVFRLYWNEGEPSAAQIPSIPDGQGPAPETSGGDGIAKLQVTRTLSATRFKSLNGRSEKGILESYLRAFNAAEKFIYLENQYFTDAIIAEALKAVLKAKPELELILVINIKPDVPLYPGRQARLIDQIRAAAPGQVGAFTRWSYAHDHPRPWVAPIYLHSKLGVVDDTWATIGTANLDGLSLDYNMLLSPLVFGETTAAETNISILSAGQGPTNVTPAELTRRRLWAEHLGILDGAGKPNPSDGFLSDTPMTKWVPLWQQEAKKALDHLKVGTREPLPGFVLEYPTDAGGVDTPRRHLEKLGVTLDLGAPVVRPIGVTRAFDFFSGRWKVPNREDFVGATRKSQQ